MCTEYTAELITINDGYVDPDGNWASRDIIGIYKNGVNVDIIAVKSSEDPAGYDAAVVRVIGSHDFKWVN